MDFLAMVNSALPQHRATMTLMDLVVWCVVWFVVLYIQLWLIAGVISLGALALCGALPSLAAIRMNVRPPRQKRRKVR